VRLSVAINGEKLTCGPIKRAQALFSITKSIGKWSIPQGIRYSEVQSVHRARVPNFQGEVF